MTTKKAKNQTIMFAVLGIVIVVLAIAVVTLLPKQQSTDQNQSKTVSVPVEIKSNQEAVTLEKDTSSILKEVGDTLNNIDSSLPDV